MSDKYCLMTKSNGAVSIELPKTGKLSINYGCNTPNEAQVYLYSCDDRKMTPIPVGESVMSVGSGDYLIYQLLNPSCTIELIWSYT